MNQSPFERTKEEIFPLIDNDNVGHKRDPKEHNFKSKQMK